MSRLAARSHTPPTRTSRRRGATVVLALLPLALIAMSATGCEPMFDGSTRDCTVTQKSAIAKGGDSIATSYRVYTDCGMFAIEQDLSRDRWSAADTYAGLQLGSTYDFEASGWRNDILSQVPNITSATEIDS